MKKRGTITIKDVARKAGVSPSTVSRVISKNPKISEDTSNRVMKIMDELGYYPNEIARSLVKQKSGSIGVIMPTTSEDVLLNPFFPEALRGIVKGASKTGYDLLLSTNSDKNEELKAVQNFIRGSKVDGIILMSSKINDECINYLCSLDFPFSLIGTPDKNLERINHVDNDNYMAAYELTTYLAKLGRKKIAIIAGEKELMVTQKRVEGYEKALSESNLIYDKDLVFTGSFDEVTGYKYGEIIGYSENRPDGIIITDDLVAYGTLKAFEAVNIRVPDDIAIASFNNSRLASYANTPITSVDINAALLGLEAVNLLVDAMESGVRGKRTITPYTIYKRKSTEG